MPIMLLSLQGIFFLWNEKFRMERLGSFFRFSENPLNDYAKFGQWFLRITQLFSLACLSWRL